MTVRYGPPIAITRVVASGKTVTLGYWAKVTAAGAEVITGNTDNPYGIAMASGVAGEYVDFATEGHAYAIVAATITVAEGDTLYLAAAGTVTNVGGANLRQVGIATSGGAAGTLIGMTIDRGIDNG